MTFEEYERAGRHLYEAFAKLVATLLSEARAIYKAIVGKLASDDELLSSVRVGLERTGIVSGEFGMAEAYKERRAAVAQWLEDGDERVRQFAKTHVAQLDRMIASEQRRAEEDLEFRKRSWGTGAGDDNAGA